MQPYNVFFAKNGSNVATRQLPTKDCPSCSPTASTGHHTAHVLQHHSMQSVSTASSDSPGLNDHEEWSKLHLAKSFGKCQAIGNPNSILTTAQSIEMQQH